MGFWIRTAIIGIILIGLGVAFFLNKDLLLSMTQEVVEEPASSVENKKVEDEQSGSDKNKPKPDEKKKKTNAAAEGMSNFYAKVYGDDGKRKIRNNVIYLPEPEGDLIEILHARSKVVRPYSKAWGGEKESRPFRKGETLYQKLSDFAGKEGVEIIWWINRDLIVKDAFRIDKNLVKTAKQISNALAGHFIDGVNSYFCYRQRAIVMVNEQVPFLNEECTLLN